MGLVSAQGLSLFDVTRHCVCHTFPRLQDDVEVRRGGSAAASAGPQVFGDAQVHRRGPGPEDGVGQAYSCLSRLS